MWREYGIPDQPAWAFINDDGTVQVVVGQLGQETLTEQVQLLIDA